MLTNSIYNKKQIAKSFSRAATTYDRAAILQRNVGQHLLDKLIKLEFHQKIPGVPKVIVDLGSGTGQLTQQLVLNFPKSSIIAVDIAFGMLSYSQLKYPKNNVVLLCGDVEQLPLKNNSCDVVFSNLMFQWSPDYKKSLQESSRILKPNGMLLFSTLGPDTLKELRHCWQQVDNWPRVHSFVPNKKLIKTLKKYKFSNVSMETKRDYRYFSKAIDLMRELKLLGASNIQNGRTKNVTSNKKLQRVFENYEQFRNGQEFLPATYEIYFIIAQKAP